MSKTDEQTATPKQQTTYVVVRANEDGTYAVVSASVTALTSDAAKKSVAATLGLGSGESVTLLAVPSKSWKPKTFTVEVPEPRLVAA